MRKIFWCSLCRNHLLRTAPPSAPLPPTPPSLRRRTPSRAPSFFPEYYEWLDEISPAHIFSRSIHGEGFRMRKCFENGRINYEKYDQCFENALKVESANTLCRIAIARLRWPAGLKEEARTLYEHCIERESAHCHHSGCQGQRPCAAALSLAGTFPPETTARPSHPAWTPTGARAAPG